MRTLLLRDLLIYRLPIGQDVPPFEKGGQGGIYRAHEIPLNPPFLKGDFLAAEVVGRVRRQP